MGGRGAWSPGWRARSRSQPNQGTGTSVNQSDLSVLLTGYIVPQLDQSMFSSTLRTPTASNNTDLATMLAVTDTPVSAEEIPADRIIGSESLASGQLSYTVIDQEAALGGAIYPFLEASGRAWRIIESSVKEPSAYPNPHTFGMDKPTLRYVNGSKIEDVFVDGLTTEELLARTGLQLSMDKGGFVLSKRLSRIMRPYFASGYFPEEAVRVKYMDDLTADQVKVWDGAGLISRAMLERLVTYHFSTTRLPIPGGRYYVMPM